MLPSLLGRISPRRRIPKEHTNEQKCLSVSDRESHLVIRKMEEAAEVGD
jgi:hypothetical protein